MLCLCVDGEWRGVYPSPSLEQEICPHHGASSLALPSALTGAHVPVRAGEGPSPRCRAALVPKHIP